MEWYKIAADEYVVSDPQTEGLRAGYADLKQHGVDPVAAAEAAKAMFDFASRGMQAGWNFEEVGQAMGMLDRLGISYEAPLPSEPPQETGDMDPLGLFEEPVAEQQPGAMVPGAGQEPPAQQPRQRTPWRRRQRNKKRLRGL